MATQRLLFRTFVSKDFRGKGIAKELIKVLVVRVEKPGSIEQINLTVIAYNKSAKTLYEKFGFQTFSSEERAIKWERKIFYRRSNGFKN
ncbi:MAG: GNAT family N-acetyltransferase [Segetibacter sp.]